MTSQNLPCPVCLHNNYSSYFVQPDYKLLHCQNCGLIRTLLSNAKNFVGAELYAASKEANKHTQSNHGQFPKYAQNLLNFIGKSSGKLLDVGCGFGWLVWQAKALGYDAIGIDISSPFVQAGKKKLHVDLRRSSLEDYKTPEKFDIIVMNHVLEHIEDPNKFLKKAHSLLAANGALCVAVPNIHSLMFYIFKDRWYGLQPGQHLWQFTHATLTRLLEKNGFTVDKLVTTCLDYNPTSWKSLAFKMLTKTANLIALGDQIYLLAKR